LQPPRSEHLLCGYKTYLTEEADNKWKCIFCKLIIKEPIQLTECGHRACKGCFESRAAAAIDGNMICPVEDCKIEYIKTQTMPDRAFKKELDLYSITCYYKKMVTVLGKDH